MSSLLLQASTAGYAFRGAVSEKPCSSVAPRTLSINKPLSRRQSKHLQKAVWAAAAAVEGDVDDLEEPGEEEAQASAEAQTSDASTEGLDFALNFLWMDKNIAVAVDQVFTRDQRSPVTEYFFWPRKDAWEELKVALEAKPWINTRDKIILLNRTTEVINFWQTDGEKPSIEQAQQAFPDCIFKGS